MMGSRLLPKTFDSLLLSPPRFLTVALFPVVCSMRAKPPKVASFGNVANVILSYSNPFNQTGPNLQKVFPSDYILIPNITIDRHIS